MSGRGDNNKHGTSGRGSSNQSSQAFGETATKEKSNHGGQTGGSRSESQKKQEDRSANRNPGPSRQENC